MSGKEMGKEFSGQKMKRLMSVRQMTKNISEKKEETGFRITLSACSHLVDR